MTTTAAPCDGADAEAGVRTAPALIRYLAEGDFVTRRYVSRGVEINTGEYRDYPMPVRDGSAIRDHFALDVHGFVLARAPSGLADFDDRAALDGAYLAEIERQVAALTGADRVAAQGWMKRTSADLTAQAKASAEGYVHTGGIQPPAGEAHVDYNARTARAAAARVHAARFAGAPPYRRFIAFSAWRVLSPPPQDWPLAVCDGRSVEDGETASNTLFVVDALPVGEALTGPVAGEDEMIAATIFRHRARHRWWYFSAMTRDDLLLFKFFDSDQSVTWRCPHTAFHDTSLPGAGTRLSIEVRGIAFFDLVREDD